MKPFSLTKTAIIVSNPNYLGRNKLCLNNSIYNYSVRSGRQFLFQKTIPHEQKS